MASRWRNAAGERIRDGAGDRTRCAYCPCFDDYRGGVTLEMDYVVLTVGDYRGGVTLEIDIQNLSGPT